MSDKFELMFIFFSVICGVLSAAYFYQTSAIFTNLLKKPLHMIAGGMIVMSVGVLLAAFISYESKAGIDFIIYGIPLQALFYFMYIVGSVIIFLGARKLIYRPQN